jgi:hypothetical protein
MALLLVRSLLLKLKSQFKGDNKSIQKKTGRETSNLQPASFHFPILLTFDNFQNYLQMIKYLRHDEIDTEKWDDCINKAFNGRIYAYTWYLDMVNENWEALVENDYERVFPLTPRKKFGINYLFQPRFTQQLGVFSQSILSKETVQRFLDAIPGKFKFIDINLNSFNPLKTVDGEIEPWLNHELDLINSYEKIVSNYTTNLKRNLKKAQKSPVTLVKNIKPEDVIDLFKQNKGMDLDNLGEADYELLRRLIYVMVYKRIVEVVGAYSEMNELCAGVFFVKDNKKVIFYFSATNEYAREHAAMPMLIDSFIRDNAHSHLTLDFEGSNDTNLARFYKSFGAKELTYPHYRSNRLNLILKSGFEFIKKFR